MRFAGALGNLALNPEACEAAGAAGAGEAMRVALTCDAILHNEPAMDQVRREDCPDLRAGGVGERRATSSVKARCNDVYHHKWPTLITSQRPHFA